MKFYISGPITGMEDGNKQIFDKSANKLREIGYDTLNPWDLDLIDKQSNWKNNLRRDIKYLVDCDAVLLLPGWELSPGAELEVTIAYYLGMGFYRWKGGSLVNMQITIDQDIIPLVSSTLWEAALI